LAIVPINSPELTDEILDGCIADSNITPNLWGKFLNIPNGEKR
jgi:hypothetical protein